MEAIGFSSGIWLIWNSNWKVKVIENYHQFIHVKMSGGFAKDMFFTAIYRGPMATLTQHLWPLLSSLGVEQFEAWMLAKHFNAFLTADEKRGGWVIERESVVVSLSGLVRWS